MAPKKDEKADDSEYTYTDVDEDEAALPPEPAPPPPGRDARASGRKAAKESRPTRSAPEVPAREESVGRESSSDRAPRARSLEAPLRLRAPQKDKGRRSTSPRRDGDDHEEERGGGSAVPEPANPPRQPTRAKGKGKSRSQYCIHCWQRVKSSGGRAGLSQHMFWNETCLAWQQYGDGSRCSWEEAMQRAHALKQDREREAVEEFASEKPVPARSLGHLRSIEARDEDVKEHRGKVKQERADKEGGCERFDAEKLKRRAHRRRRRHPSPSPDVRAGPKRSRRPPSSDDEHDERTGKATRRSEQSDEVWIRVPRASLRGY